MKIGNSHSGAEELEIMYQLGIDIFGMIKTHLSWTHEARTTLAAMITIKFDYGSLVTSSARQNEEGYLPGGTAMIAMGRFAGCIMKRFADSMDRYTYMKLRGKYGNDVIIITIYRVYQKTGVKTGPDTAYSQQYVEP